MKNSMYCEPSEIVYMSNPTQYKCKKCGQMWFTTEQVPICPMPTIDNKDEQRFCLNCGEPEGFHCKHKYEATPTPEKNKECKCECHKETVAMLDKVPEGLTRIYNKKCCVACHAPEKKKLCRVCNSYEPYYPDTGRLCKKCFNEACLKRYYLNRDKKLAQQRAYKQTEKGKKAQSIANKNNVLNHYPEMLARRKLRQAIKTGKIIRQPCEVCGEKETHGHHTDYSKPLDVKWLCVKHHLEAHGKNYAK